VAVPRVAHRADKVPAAVAVAAVQAAVVDEAVQVAVLRQRPQARS